jgi:hypothetical protein
MVGCRFLKGFEQIQQMRQSIGKGELHSLSLKRMRKIRRVMVLASSEPIRAVQKRVRQKKE